MQIVTDQGADLSAEQIAGIAIHSVPLQITLSGKSYVGGVDIDNDTFYRLLSETQDFPSTSQPSPGDFAKLYGQLAKTDPDILSIHLSSGLSGTVKAAGLGAEMVPEAHVTIVDSKTLSCPLGWQVEAAAKALRAGWSLEKILAYLERVRCESEGMFTLTDMKYLMHGGRISHLKGLMASVLKIKPVIGVSKDEGKYFVMGQEFTFKRAIQKIVEVISEKIPKGTTLRVQLLHGNNLNGLEMLRECLNESYECWYNRPLAIAPLLGAHTGPSLVGLAVAPLDLFKFPELEIFPAAVPALA
jgi:DegV family protein with EDD domain